ncbi:hypothetical protein FRC09_003934 [Ceratobasidium sp. 395]|nr:hypothetical protein FRC09_003934 [Ceratobasidium sp. 395]
MDDESNLPDLADFFFHNCGDKTSYSSSLEGLFVCYTLTRGLQLEGVNPRRPALPLELILRITRFAGYMDANPDPSLTLDINLPDDFIDELRPNYHSPPLSRRHIASMARIHIVQPLDPNDLPTGLPFYLECKFNSFGQCALISRKDGSRVDLIPADISWDTPDKFDLICIPNHFTPDYMQHLFKQDNVPIAIGFGRKAQVLFWKWWAPKF